MISLLFRGYPFTCNFCGAHFLDKGVHQLGDYYWVFRLSVYHILSISLSFEKNLWRRVGKKYTDEFVLEKLKMGVS